MTSPVEPQIVVIDGLRYREATLVEILASLRLEPQLFRLFNDVWWVRA